MSVTRMAGGLAAGAIMLLLAMIATPSVQGQGKVKFSDELAKDAIRTSHTSWSLQYRQATLFDGKELAVNKRELSRQYAMQEYVAEVRDGRPTKLYRSYDPISGKNKLWFSEGSDPVEVDATDPRSGHTFLFNVDDNGTCTLALEPLQILAAKDVHSAATDHSPRMAPRGEAEAGASWNVAARDFGFVGIMGAGETLTELEVTATLDGVNAGEDGRELAWVSYTASAKSTYREINELDGSEAANVECEYSLNGKVGYVPGGSLALWTHSGTCAAKGKMGGMDATLAISWSASRRFFYGWLRDVRADNGKEGPDTVDDLYTVKAGAVPAQEIVIAREGAISRLQTFDPATRKITKTLAALPKGIYLTDVALSPDRKRVAFRSNGNKGISIAEANVFMLELESGQVNQLTPSWATNKGVSMPLDTGKTVTITGRLVWFDDERGINRHDGLGIGWVRIDQTTCFSTIDAFSGKFKLENVPANSSLVICALASLPNYSNGKSRGWRFLPDGKATGTTVIMTGEGDKDIGDFSVRPPAVEFGYGSPSFAKGGDVVCNRYPGSNVAIVGYPKRTWKEVEVDPNLGLLTGALAVSPDASMLSFVTDSSGGKGSVHFYDSRGKEVWGTALAENVEVSYSSQGAWLADGSGWVCTAGAPGWLGKDRYGMPGLIYASPAEKRVTFARKWPQLGGYACKSIALNKEGTVAYLVLHFTDEKGVTWGDLWQWDSTTDTLSRLTNLGDVLGVANIGR